MTSPAAERLLRRVYAKPLAAGIPALVMDLETAELVKVSANAFLATKISFINAMAEVCEAAGADVVRLAEALGHDGRIGRKCLGPGLGFGGGCLPKDIRAFRATAAGLGVTSVASLLGMVDAINLGRRDRVTSLARVAAGGTLSGKRVAVLGIAFKPNSDDIRDSPSLDVCGRLAAAGAIVSVHDPVAMPNAARQRPDLRYAASVPEAADGGRPAPAPDRVGGLPGDRPGRAGPVVARRAIIDARCALDAGLWRRPAGPCTSSGAPDLSAAAFRHPGVSCRRGRGVGRSRPHRPGRRRARPAGRRCRVPPGAGHGQLHLVHPGRAQLTGRRPARGKPDSRTELTGADTSGGRTGTAPEGG